MSESMITLQGYVGSEPTLRTAGAHQVANFRVATTPRRLNRTTGEWTEGPTQWFTVNAWRHLGVNVQESVKKGDAVFVHGRLIARTWVNREGVEVSGFEIDAVVVGHDLTRGRSMMMRTSRHLEQPAPAPRESIPDQWRAPGVERADGPVADPWADQVAGPAAGTTEEAAVPAA